MAKIGNFPGKRQRTCASNTMPKEWLFSGHYCMNHVSPNGRIDIAAWVIAPDETFRAVGTVMDLDSSLEINLVDVNTYTSSLLKTIEEEAVDL
jgi:hypothetical protein